MMDSYYIRFKGRGRAPRNFKPEFMEDVKKVTEKYKDLINIFEISEECINFEDISENGGVLCFIPEERTAMCDKTCGLPYTKVLQLIFFLFCKHYPERGEISTENEDGWETSATEIKEMFGYNVSDVLKSLLKRIGEEVYGY